MRFLLPLALALNLTALLPAAAVGNDKKKSKCENFLDPSDATSLNYPMMRLNISRFEAAELRAYNRSRFGYFGTDQALKEIRDGKGPSGARPKDLAKFKAIVALDMDGTLLDQRSERNEGTTHEFTDPYYGRKVFVGVAPGALEFLKSLKERGLGVILMSRNDDYIVHAIANLILIDNVKLKDYIDGVLTDAHMSWGQGYGMFTWRQSNYFKDLRLLDERGERAIILDDDPKWVRPADHARMYYMSRFSSSRMKRLEARQYRYVYQFELALAAVDAALEISAQEKISFAAAFERYSFKAEAELISAVEWLHDKGQKKAAESLGDKIGSKEIGTLNRARRDKALAGEILTLYRNSKKSI